jgi:hypothetical protein
MKQIDAGGILDMAMSGTKKQLLSWRGVGKAHSW